MCIRDRNAVVRFGLDRGYSKQGVFTAGAASIGVGFLVFAAAFPLVGKLPFLNDRALLLYAYVPVSYTHLDVYKRQRCTTRRSRSSRRWRR